MERITVCLTLCCAICAEHRQSQHNIIPETKHILHQMDDPIRENTDKQTLQQPSEGVGTEQQLHQNSGQLWDYREHSHQHELNRKHVLAQ